MSDPPDTQKYPTLVSIETRPLLVHFLAWGFIGLCCVFFARTPVPSLLLCLAVGVIAGIAHAGFLAHVKFVLARWVGLAAGVFLLVLYFNVAVPRQWPIGAPLWMAALGLGALTSACERLVVWFFAGRIERILTERYLGTELQADRLRRNPEWIKPPPAVRVTSEQFIADEPPVPLEEALAELEKGLPPELYQLLAGRQQPAWPLRPATELSSPIHSKLGGRPCVPNDFVWPSSGDVPLGFLGQIDLAEVPNMSLETQIPAQGLVSFFVDFTNPPWGTAEEQDHARVLYFPDVETCREIEAQAPNTNLQVISSQVADGISMRFLEVTTIPEPAAVHDWILEDSIANRGESFGTELEAYAESAFYNWGDQFLGHAEFWYGSNPVEDPQEANRYYGLFGETPWQLLLKVGSHDDDLGWMWGDAGTLFFWIPIADLQSLRFDRVWVTLECS